MNKNMEREKCVVPISFASGEYAGVKKESWSDKLRKNADSMAIPDPDYVPPIAVEASSELSKVNNPEQAFDMQNFMNGMVASLAGKRIVKETETKTREDKRTSELDEYAYMLQKSKNKANEE